MDMLVATCSVLLLCTMIIFHCSCHHLASPVKSSFCGSSIFVTLTSSAFCLWCLG